MVKQDVLERLCRLISRVGEEVYHSEYTHECFCARDTFNAMISGEILAFVENAVNVRILETRMARQMASEWYAEGGH